MVNCSVESLVSRWVEQLVHSKGSLLVGYLALLSAAQKEISKVEKLAGN